MDLNQIKEKIEKCFVEDNHRIVFWNDPNGEFATFLDELVSDNVTILRLNEMSALEVKIMLEIYDKEGLYLLYDPREEPNFDEDWLLDLRLCSESFRADKSSIILSDLGLIQQQLRPYIEKRRKFFDSKDRFQKIKTFINKMDSEIDLDRHMLAVLTKSDQSDLYTILFNLFSECVSEDGVDLINPTAKWSQIEKFDLETAFWEMVKVKFGYSDEGPNLRKLLHRLFVSDFAIQSRKGLHSSLIQFSLPSSGQSNAVVCLAQWRDSLKFGTSYDPIAIYIGEELNINYHVNELDLEVLASMDTFDSIEDAVERKLLKRLLDTVSTINSNDIKQIAKKRQISHWVKSEVSQPEGKRRMATYECIIKAAEFFDLKIKYFEGFRFKSSFDMYKSYETEIYKFDQLYRQFCINADEVDAGISDLLKPLRDLVEDNYCNWYLQKLSLAWGSYIGGGLLDTWKIDDIPNQYEFYSGNIENYVDKADKRRAFVIISDALRYEVAQEICEALNGQYRFDATLTSQLGVLPSYTSLGMAALLPHNKIEFNQAGDVLVNGKSTSSLASRDEILNSYQGMAVEADKLTALKKEDGRKLIEAKKLVYIYHNEIDARGDKAVTESDTFLACRDAISDLIAIVRYIIDNLNGNHIVLTADHGFHFTESAPNETDKSKLLSIPKNAFKFKKRYLLGRALPDYSEAWHGRTSVTARTSDDVEFWIPKGASRFHFTGGAKFIHGGALPQEIVVPILTVKQVKNEDKLEKTKIRQVSVQVLGTRHKVTSQKHRFHLIQTEAISDRVKAITVKVGIYSGTELISSLETITFDSASDKIEERQKEVFLTLKGQQFDKNQTYHFIIIEADTLIEIQKIEITIDRMIADEF